MGAASESGWTSRFGVKFAAYLQRLADETTRNGAE